MPSYRLQELYHDLREGVPAFKITDSVLGGDDVALYLDGLEAVAVDDSGELARSTSHGSVVQAALDALGENDSLKWVRGSYDCTDVSELVIGNNGGTDDSNQYIDAGGVVVNQTVRNVAKGATVEGLLVDGASGDGIILARAQWCTFDNVGAHNCGGNGWVLAGAQDLQVTNGTFDGCSAINNGGHGLLLDGTPSNAWVNANTFEMFTSRANGGWGVRVTGGAAEYNTFVGMQVEGNTTGSIYLSGARDNSFFGGHWVSQARFDDGRNYVYGGRWANGFDLTNGVAPVGFGAGAPNPDDDLAGTVLTADLSTVTPWAGYGYLAADDGTNTTSGNRELAVWDPSAASGSGAWITSGGDVISP